MPSYRVLASDRRCTFFYIGPEFVQLLMSYGNDRPKGGRSKEVPECRPVQRKREAFSLKYLISTVLRRRGLKQEGLASSRADHSLAPDQSAESNQIEPIGVA